MRIVWADRGPRTLKYHQLLDERLSLQPDERALMTVLLLRGPQAPGELRTRTERLHSFADREAVEAVLQRLAALPTPLVRELERRPGQHDNRWMHLLGPAPAEVAPVAGDTSASTARAVLAGRPGRSRREGRDDVRRGRAVATPTWLDAELTAKPLDRWLLDRVAALAGDGPVVDVGTGPGHVAAYLASAGRDRDRRRPVAGHGRGGSPATPGPDLRRRRPDQPAPAPAGGAGVGQP